MGKTRQVGTSGARPITRGREPAQIGTPIGKGRGTRPLPMPPVKRTYTHCIEKNKKGLPCKAPNMKGKPYCVGHFRAKEAAA